MKAVTVHIYHRHLLLLCILKANTHLASHKCEKPSQPRHIVLMACLLHDRKGICPVRNLRHSSPNVHFHSKWRENTDPADPGYLENGGGGSGGELEPELLLLRLFNGLFSRTTWVSGHQKGKPFWILLEQEMIGWQKPIHSCAYYSERVGLCSVKACACFCC